MQNTHSFRGTVILIALAITASALAQNDGPSHLPIDLPKGANISFEAEGEGKEFVPMIKRYLVAQSDDPTDKSGPKVKFKTPLGDMNLTLDDLKPIISQVRYLHVVVYSGAKTVDPFEMQEQRLKSVGMKKVLKAPGGDGPLVMKRDHGPEQYGIVAKSNGSIVVLRTDGGPKLGDFGQLAYQALAQLFQQSSKKKSFR